MKIAITRLLQIAACVTLLCSLVLGSSLLAAGASNESSKEISILKGGSTRLQVAEGVGRVVVGNEKVIDVRPATDGLSVMINGLNEGASDLHITKNQGDEMIYRVTVRADMQETLKVIKSLLDDVEGVDVGVLNDKIMIKGTILTVPDVKRVRDIAEAYPGQVINLAKLDQRRVYRFIEDEIQKDLKDSGLDTVFAKVVNDQIRLSGVVINQEEQERALKIAQLRMPSPINMMRIEDAMIETDIRFVQISSDNSSSFGNNILKSLGANSGTAFGGGSSGKPSLSYGVSASAATRINALIGDGSATNLMQTHLSTKNGEEGRFQSGGQDNIAVAGVNGGDLKAVDYGIIIRVKPTLRTRELVENKVYIEVSVPVQKTREGLILDKFNSEGTIMSKRGESVILSGLLQSLSSKTAQRTPLLGYVPILDMFFAEREKKRGRKELVAVITPRAVLPSADGGVPFSDRSRKLLEPVATAQ